MRNIYYSLQQLRNKSKYLSSVTMKDKYDLKSLATLLMPQNMLAYIPDDTLTENSRKYIMLHYFLSELITK